MFLDSLQGMVALLSPLRQTLGGGANLGMLLQRSRRNTRSMRRPHSTPCHDESVGNVGTDEFWWLIRANLCKSTVSLNLKNWKRHRVTGVFKSHRRHLRWTKLVCQGREGHALRCGLRCSDLRGAQDWAHGEITDRSIYIHIYIDIYRYMHYIITECIILHGIVYMHMHNMH